MLLLTTAIIVDQYIVTGYHAVSVMLLLTTAIIVDQYIVTGYHAVSVMLLLTTAIVELLISILLPGIMQCL